MLFRQVLHIIQDKEYFKDIVSKIIATRERTADSLRALGFKVLDSSTNFLFASHYEHSAKDIFEYLKSKKIFIRYFDKPRIENYLRITIGTDEEYGRFFSSGQGIFRKITENKPAVMRQAL